MHQDRDEAIAHLVAAGDMASQRAGEGVVHGVVDERSAVRGVERVVQTLSQRRVLADEGLDTRAHREALVGVGDRGGVECRLDPFASCDDRFDQRGRAGRVSVERLPPARERSVAPDAHRGGIEIGRQVVA